MVDTTYTWGCDGIDAWKQSGGVPLKAKINGYSRSRLANMNLTSLFLFMFPNTFINDVILLTSNEALMEGAKKIIKGEFLRWLGFWFLMGTEFLFTTSS